jgi:hypothetical protein
MSTGRGEVIAFKPRPTIKIGKMRIENRGLERRKKGAPIMMKNITRRSIAFAATIVIALCSLTFAAPASNYITITGRVLKINKQERTLLVSDQLTKKLYMVNVPEGATFTITFGQNMKMSQPVFRDANKNDRVRLLCKRTDKEHLAKLADGSEAIVLTVTE